MAGANVEAAFSAHVVRHCSGPGADRRPFFVGRRLALLILFAPIQLSKPRRFPTWIGWAV